ncbi:MAG: DMT family transporter [Pseudomonadota bacterium]|nr:DMT family transporter [Pseudomonadota bacterium]
MLLGSVLFAGMATFVGFAHRRDPSLSTFTSSAFRSVVNLLALVIVSWRAPLQLVGDARPALWARGLLGAVALLTYFACIRYVSLGEAAFLNQTSAIWVALLAPWLLGQRTSIAAWIAIAGSLAGVGLLAHPRPGSDDTLGRALGLASGLAAAGAYVSVNKASATNSSVTIVFWFTLMSSIASIALMLATGARLPVDLVTAGYLVGAGLSATAAQLLMTAAYRDGHVASVAAAGAASPLITTLLGWVLLDQVPDTRARFGMAVLVVCSAVLPFWGARRRGV